MRLMPLAVPRESVDRFARWRTLKWPVRAVRLQYRRTTVCGVEANVPTLSHKVPADKELAVKMAERFFPCAREAGIFHGPRGGLIDGPAEAGLIALYGVLHNGIKLTKPLTLV